jgi:hypothetical protein
MKKPVALFPAGLSMLLLGIHPAVHAQQASADTQAGNVAILLNTVNGTGILVSIVVIIAAGLLDMQIVIDFHVGLDQNARLAGDLIREAAATSRFVYLPKPIVVLVSQVVLEQCIALRLRLKIYVLDTKYEKALETDITLRVMDAFAKHGILPPAVFHRDPDTTAVPPEKEINLESGITL